MAKSQTQLTHRGPAQWVWTDLKHGGQKERFERDHRRGALERYGHLDGRRLSIVATHVSVRRPGRPQLKRTERQRPVSDRRQAVVAR